MAEPNEPNPFESPATVNESLPARTQNLRRFRPLLIVAGVILTPVAAVVCGLFGCFVGLSTHTAPSFSVDSAITLSLFLMTLFGLAAGGLVIYLLYRLWRSWSREPEIEESEHDE